MNPLVVLAVCLALTVAIEGALILVFSRKLRWVYYSLLCNLLTNPALNALLMLWSYFFARGYYVALAMLEVAAVFIEALVYTRLCEIKFYRALLLSLALNAASFGVGMLIF